MNWPWNVKSTIRKAEPRKHNTKLDCFWKSGRYLQLCSFTAFHCEISCTTAFGNNDSRSRHSALVEVFAATRPECDPTAPTSNPLHGFIRFHYKDVWKYLDFMMRLSGEGSFIRAAPSTHRWIIGMLILVCQHYWSQVQMLLNISMAMYPRKVPRKWTVSLASWQPRWVAKAPPQEQKSQGLWADKFNFSSSTPIPSHSKIFYISTNLFEIRRQGKQPPFSSQVAALGRDFQSNFGQQNSVGLGSPLISSPWSNSVPRFGSLAFMAFIYSFVALGFLHTKWCRSLSMSSTVIVSWWSIYTYSIHVYTMSICPIIRIISFSETETLSSKGAWFGNVHFRPRYWPSLTVCSRFSSCLCYAMQKSCWKTIQAHILLSNLFWDAASSSLV